MSPVLGDPDAAALVAPALVAAAELGDAADEEELDELDEQAASATAIGMVRASHVARLGLIFVSFQSKGLVKGSRMAAAMPTPRAGGWGYSGAAGADLA